MYNNSSSTTRRKLRQVLSEIVIAPVVNRNLLRLLVIPLSDKVSRQISFGSITASLKIGTITLHM